ncbi:MAG: ammonia-forming cytochrome c nitrite reductase subunit c552 [Deltaproteobacteria bacterium]|nr:ammonia-forming cytochrome c nitrite reductase subunit c552 [Deltaproteobacteria bacterium]TLN04244.1 MAG: ammonia-forming cytochrome c nitrite reductase subunit c552 [bacterium]
MLKKMFAVFTGVGSLLVIVLLPMLSPAAKTKNVAQSAVISPDTCYGCHDEIRALKEKSKHAELSCTTCHGMLQEHLANYEQKPTTTIDQGLCGKCHQNESKGLMMVNYQAPARKEKGVPTGRSPMMDKLLEPYGFTFEHNEPRSHAFMVTDQFVVDRFAGGRYRYKKGWHGVDDVGPTWDVLEDTGKTLQETAKAGNPTCIQCKTSDHILTWKFLGDKDPAAKWDRSSDVQAVAKATNNPMGCIHCHDPHGGQPRIVRDALIKEVVQNGSQMFAGRNGKTDLTVVDFRGFRKIGIQGKADSRMMCAQCHVEYACGPGFEFDSGKKIGFDDPRTNHFPLTGPKELLAHYKKLNFYDFKHAVTGARLVKLQHPEAETFFGSIHDRNGVTCADCHMPPMKDASGKSYRNHGVIRPIHDVKAACMRCHQNSTVRKKLYEIETIQNYIRGKMRKSEYWLGRLIDTYEVAKRTGVAEPVLAQAREKHEEAHVLWEWWTAENSDGFHNPELARETLAASISASKAGVALLNKAMPGQQAAEEKKK